MAKSKSTTSTPKAKSKVSTPKSAPAIPAVLTIPSPSNPSHEDNHVAETATPARKQAKRKAPQDDAPFTTSGSSSSLTKKPKVSIHTEQVALTSTSASGKKATHKHRKVHIEIPASSVSTPAKGKHIVFNDADDDVEEDPSEFFTPQEDVKTNPLEAQLSKAAHEAQSEAKGDSGDDDDDDDDDDEAPEAVSTSTAAAQAAKATQAAARAVESQQDEERRKRQERDAKFRKQAEARKKQQASTAAATAAAAAKVDGESDDDAPAKETPSDSRLITSLATSSRKRLDKRSLPSVLPDEFLESDSEEEEDDAGEATQGSGRAKKITFNTATRQVAKAEPRHPADQRVGATVYRVMKAQGEGKLAPRGGKYSKNAKEMLLGRGRTVPRTGVKKKGFLVR